MPDADLLVDPYLLGYWIGNGSAAKPEITVRRGDVEAVAANIPYVLCNRYEQEGFSDILVYKELKLILVRNYREKRIPASYLRASLLQRKRLLQGLMDEARHFVLPPRRQGHRFPREVKRSCRSKYPPKKSQSGLN